MQTTRPRITQFYQWLKFCIFKEIFDQVRKDLDYGVAQLNKTSQRLTLYLYLATDNNYIVLENDNTVLIKGLKEL